MFLQKYSNYIQRELSITEHLSQQKLPLVLIAGFRAGLAVLNLGYPENPALKPRKPS